jgi:uncharacterized protein
MDKGLPAILINRADLANGGLTWKGSLPVEGLAADEAATLVSASVDGLRITESNNGGIRLTGSIDTVIEFRCRRCLEAGSSEGQVELDVRLEPEVEPWDEAPGIYALDRQLEAVDLWPALREELILSLPEFPVCRGDCKGLCGACGSDLNEGPCGCVVSESDPRWEALLSIARADGDDDKSQEGR